MNDDRWLLRVAVGLFVIGLVAMAVLFIYPAVSSGTAPLTVYLLTMAAPAGFLCGLIFALRSGRRSRTVSK